MSLLDGSVANHQPATVKAASHVVSAGRHVLHYNAACEGMDLQVILTAEGSSSYPCQPPKRTNYSKYESVIGKI